MNSEHDLQQRRRLPTQERARRTVDDIVEATAQIILRDGFEGLSTNRIAKVAGVSVGSVYQYFPNKEAVLVALAEREQERLQERLAGLMKVGVDLPVDVFIANVVPAMFAMRKEHARLLAAIERSLPPQPGMRPRVTFAESLRDVVRRLLERRRDDIRDVDSDLASFVIVHALQGNFGALDQGLEPWFLDDDELVAELVVLLQRFLAK